MEQSYVVWMFLLFSFVMASCSQTSKPAKNIKMNSLFTDHMVLQRQIQVPIWGTANPKGEIKVEIANQIHRTVAGKDGNWKVLLNPLESGGPLELIVSGENTISIKDVLVGEVWLGSGQSNMEMPLAGWGKVLRIRYS